MTATLINLDALHAAEAVTCPKCKAKPGYWCMSTGGGNDAYVATHKARGSRVAGWPQEFAAEAGRLVEQARRAAGDGSVWADMTGFDFTRFEGAAAPAIKAKRTSPTGVRLTENQAEEIERLVACGGYGSVSTAHFSGDHQHRQTMNSLERKGIVAFVEGTPDYYSRQMKLTEFGWQVYDQHRLIIKRLTDAQVAEQRARAESGRCLSCGDQPGVTDGCEECGLTRYVIADEVIRRFNSRHPVGSRVYYRTPTGDGLSVTTWCAFFSRDNVPMIRVEGVSGDLLLTQVEVVDAEIVSLRHCGSQGGAR